MTEDESRVLRESWQRHRMFCLKLAVKAGGSGERAIELADMFGVYILTRSELQKQAEASEASKSDGAPK